MWCDTFSKGSCSGADRRAHALFSLWGYLYTGGGSLASGHGRGQPVEWYVCCCGQSVCDCSHVWGTHCGVPLLLRDDRHVCRCLCPRLVPSGLRSSHSFVVSKAGCVGSYIGCLHLARQHGHCCQHSMSFMLAAGAVHTFFPTYTYQQVLSVTVEKHQCCPSTWL